VSTRSEATRNDSLDRRTLRVAGWRGCGDRVRARRRRRDDARPELDPPDEFLAALGLPVTEAASEVDADLLEGVVLLAPPG